MAVYDSIGKSYSAARRPDPRIAAQIHAALGEAATVADIGAGTGSYEPSATVVAVEPSEAMLGQRPARAAPGVRAVAECVPIRDKSVEAALAVLTVHHWSDPAAGIAELRRIASRRIVVLTWDADVFSRFWLVADYLPAAGRTDRRLAVPLSALVGWLGAARVEPVLVPPDCSDGFAAAYWCRPQRYLDPVARSAISMLALSDPGELAEGLDRLDADIRSGAWERKYAGLADLGAYDAGYRLLITDLE